MGWFFWSRDEAAYRPLGSGEDEVDSRARLLSPGRWAAGLLIASMAFLLVFDAAFGQTERADVKCSNIRTRREWRSLSDEEKSGYIDAATCLLSQPSRLGQNHSLYFDFAWQHVLTDSSAHHAASFLPWHRWFLQIYEDSLRSVCNFTGDLPYWDWTLDLPNITSSPIWASDKGFGGNGAPDTLAFRGGCVEDGPFAGLKVPFVNDFRYVHCLSRGFLQEGDLTREAEALRPEAMEQLMQSRDYATFRNRFEVGQHLTLPHIVHGDFSTDTAQVDPVWYLHHTQIDRLWWKWQQENPNTRIFDYGGLSADGQSTFPADLEEILHMGKLGDSVVVRQVMDTGTQGLCYRY